MATPTATETRDYLTKLYLSAFLRAPELDGLNYWSTEILVNGNSLQKVGGTVFSLPSVTQLYAVAMTDEQFVNAIYQNVFGRASDAEGLAYWVNEIVSMRATFTAEGSTNAFFEARGQLTINMINAGIGAVGAEGHDYIVNRLAVATYTVQEQIDNAISLNVVDLLGNMSTVTADDATVIAAQQAIDAIISGDIGLGQTFVLTIDTDTFTGTAADDIFTANVGINTVFNTPVDTLQAVDTLVGGGGIDTINYTSEGTAATAIGSMTGIEIMNAKSLGNLSIDTTTATGLTNLNISNVIGAVTAKASATTDVSVAMKAGTGVVGINGGKNVTVNLTDVASATNAVTIGQTTAAAGDVAVTMTGKAYTSTTANTTLSSVTVTGGTTIAVTQKAAADTAAAATDASNATITQGAVTITGNANTTQVTVKQDASVTAKNAAFTTGGVTETASVKFNALAAGDTLIMGGLTFTASKAMTASQAAEAFANLVKDGSDGTYQYGDTQAGGAASNGTYTGLFTNWTSGAASGDTVVFTSNTAKTDVTDLANTGTGTATVTTTQGKANDATPLGGVMGVVAGMVSVTDANGTIKTISIDGYGAGSSTTTTSVLETLNLSNSTDDMTVADTAATLTLNIEKLGSSTVDATLAFTLAPTTLNVKSTGNNYVDLTADATEALNVSGTGVLDIADVDLAALKTVKVTETAGLKLNTGVADTVTSVDTTATTGAVSVTIDGTKATYAGGAGKDSVTLATGLALTKAIDLGAGDDTLSFAALAVTGSTAALAGGAGTDTLSMSSAAADALDATVQTFYTGFERLTINDSAADGTALDLSKLGFTNYVTTSGSAGTLTLNKMASNGTVVMTAAATTGVTVTVTDAELVTSTADILNAVLSSASNLNAGTLTAANVETINLTSTDTNTSNGINQNSLTLTADKATSVTLTGNAALKLNMTGSTKVTSIDGSSMTGDLFVVSMNTTSATTIKGGFGNDFLQASTTGTSGDVLLGGAGNDALVANAGLNTLTGGEGRDLFKVNVASLNVNSYATVTDFTADDKVYMDGIISFASAKVTLGSTAVFQDYANAAIAQLGDNAAGWFQFGGDTYIVADKVTDGATSFTNGEDFVIKLAGMVDLTNASFNSDYFTIAL